MHKINFTCKGWMCIFYNIKQGCTVYIYFLESKEGGKGVCWQFYHAPLRVKLAHHSSKLTVRKDEKFEMHLMQNSLDYIYI